MSDYIQFNRVCKLTLVNDNSTLDLSQFRIHFNVYQSDAETPNRAVIRVYNLTDQTMQNIISNFRGVILQAGYIASSGIIFLGDVKQYKRGKEGNMDRYLEIYAADGDVHYASATMNLVIPAGTPQYQIGLNLIQNALIKGQKTPLSLDPTGMSLSTTGPLPDNGFGGTLPRGKVAYGMFRDQMRMYSRTQGARWFISQGKVCIIPNSSYRDLGQTVVLTGETGLIGYPEGTNEGVAFTCLINPQIQLGGLVWLDNRLVQQTSQLAQGFPNYTAINFLNVTDSDGRYRVLAIDYEGDTRGGPWYARCIGVAINPDKPRALAIDTGSRQ